MMLFSRRSVTALLASPLLPAPSPAWQAAYRAPNSAAIADLSVSATGVLAAAAMENGGSGRPVVIVSTDGKEWTVRPLPEKPTSLLVQDSGPLWITAESGIWRSVDQGGSWKLIHKAASLQKICFASPTHGFAAGGEKTILETTDAGGTWTALPAAAEPSTAKEFTTYQWIEFVNPRVGIITGVSRPPRSGRTSPLPAWRDPETAPRRAEWPSASLTLETRDGGKTWKHSSTSLFGRLSRVRYARDAKGIALMEFHDAFAWPSEVFSIDLRTGKSERAFRRKERAVTDALLFPSSQAILAAIEPPADPTASTLGNVHFLTTSDLAEWSEMPLSQPQQAGRVWLGGSSPENLWAALDSGVILQFTNLSPK